MLTPRDSSRFYMTVLFLFALLTLVFSQQGRAEKPVFSTRQIAENGLKLAERLKSSVQTQELAPLAERLKAIAAATEKNSTEEQRGEAQNLVDQMARLNPNLKSIDRLLFVQRHMSSGPVHMCDQYYGCNARPGGGLFILEHPFGEKPVLKNLLENRSFLNCFANLNQPRLF